MDVLTVEDLWGKDAYNDSGRYLGRIEAVGIGRDRVPRRIGVCPEAARRRLRFFSLTGARLDGRRVIVPTAATLEVLAGGRS